MSNTVAKCPSCLLNNECNSHTTSNVKCKDGNTNDCVIKDLINRCKNSIYRCETCISYGYSDDGCLNCTVGGRAKFAKEILELFKVTEQDGE